MSCRHVARSVPLRVETLEGRALLGGDLLGAGAVPWGVLFHPAAVHVSGVKTDPGAVQAILSALHGGPGSEWVQLVRRQVPNFLSVINRYAAGQINQYTTPGVAIGPGGFQPLFNGTKYDQLSLIVAGAGLEKGNTIELGTILRGPFHDPGTSYYVFAINRGKGSALGPVVASLRGITPDALVTIQVGPYGSTASGSVKDLTTGATVAIDSSRISIQGPTLRVLLPVSLLPPDARGISLAKYTYTAWSQTTPGTDITTVASLVPASSMNHVGVLTR